jgi:hypothetical protein
MGWSHICIEGFCFGEKDDGTYPCGRWYPNVNCLNRGTCPYLGYAEATGREVAFFVPLYQLVWDRIASNLDHIWWHTRYYLWDKWFFHSSLDKYPVADCSAYEKELEESKKEFDAWASPTPWKDE